MIWYYIIYFFTTFFTTIFAWLPTVTTLPFGIDGFFVTAVGYWLSFLSLAWPLQPLWACLLWYIPIQFGLIILRVFLGARMPQPSLLNF